MNLAFVVLVKNISVVAELYKNINNEIVKRIKIIAKEKIIFRFNY